MTRKESRPWIHRSIDQVEARSLCHARHRRHFGRLRRRDGQPRQQARPVQGDGRRRPAQREGARGTHRLRRALRERVAERASRGRLRAATTPSATPTSFLPSRRWCWPTKTARCSSRMPGTCRRSMWFDEEKTIDAFRTGNGVAWGDHDGRLHCGVAAFYRNGYRGSLVSQWLPALDGIVRQARGRHRGGRRGLRPRPLDRPDGASLSAVALSRLRCACGLDRRGEAQRGRCGRRRRGPTSTWRAPSDYPDQQVRAHLLLRLPARPGRSGRRRRGTRPRCLLPTAR